MSDKLQLIYCKQNVNVMHILCNRTGTDSDTSFTSCNILKKVLLLSQRYFHNITYSQKTPSLESWSSENVM